MKTIFYVLFICLISLNISIGQNISEKNHFSPAVQWTFKEKIKISPSKLLEKAKKENTIDHETLTRYTKSIKANGEINITNSSEIEAEIHAAINPIDSNNIVVSPIRQDLTNSLISCPIYYTNDFGDSWQQSSFTNMPYEAGSMSGGGGDPVFAYDKSGKLYFTWIDLYGTTNDLLFGTANMGIFWAYSNDGGATWNKPVHDTVLFGQMQMMLGMPQSILSPISDKQWMAVDMTNGPYQNNLYISYVTIGNNNSYQIKCSTKPAGVDQFTQETAITAPADYQLVQFSSLGIDNSGNVHVIFYAVDNSQNTALWHSVSTDGGTTFSTPNKISDIRFNLPMAQLTPTDLISGIKDDRLYPSPYMAGDQNNGNIYVTWTAFGIDSNLGNGSDIYFSRSTDNGTTWSTPIIVNNDQTGIGTHNYYSSIFIKSNSEIKVSWYDRRNDTSGNINTHYYYATSTDGGLSFGTNAPATGTETNFSTVGTNNQDFGIGEYTQILASDNYTIPVWCDGRENNGNLNVFIAFLNDNTTKIDKLSTITNALSVSNIYPNPASDQLNIQINMPKAGEVLISLYSVDGKYIKNLNVSYLDTGNHLIETGLGNIKSGNYLIQISSGKSIITRKITKK